ncbi:hypothetical protein EXIGLDRAFT_766434 [Exidia glandulosa HHB12029]|uniref:Uncharacterized protein n=1 Tax=Exidia glandulosa HHB12029 TaxID=1314781 RepID=A0A165JQ03_EXIGL|nr:hypothetical protein EXIGLDRAFT_766434 [Exidia glandulosa HHB12029]
MSIEHALILYEAHDSALHHPRRTPARTGYALTISCHSPDATTLVRDATDRMSLTTRRLSSTHDHCAASLTLRWNDRATTSQAALTLALCARGIHFVYLQEAGSTPNDQRLCRLRFCVPCAIQAVWSSSRYAVSHEIRSIDSTWTIGPPRRLWGVRDRLTRFTTILETTSRDSCALYDLIPGFYKPVLTITTDRGATLRSSTGPYLMATIHSTLASQDDRADGAQYSAL